MSADFDKPRPGFAKGLVVRVFEDGTSFQVKCRLDKHGESEHLVKVRLESLECSCCSCCSVAIVVMVVVVVVAVVVVVVFYFDGTY